MTRTADRQAVQDAYEASLWPRLTSGDAALTDTQRFEAVLRNPDLMALGALVPPPNESGQGRSSRFPSWLWPFVAAMTGTQGSQRRTVNWLRIPTHWFFVVDTIREVYGDDIADQLPAQPPCRTTVRHHLRRVIDVMPALKDAAGAQWVEQAREQGCLDPNNAGTWDIPSRGVTVWGDGTVVKSPVRQRKDTDKPARTAEAATFYECGEDDGHPVYGIKYITVSTRPSSTPYGRVILGQERQEGPREAQEGVDLIARIQRVCGGLIRAAAWDGALRGAHRQRLLSEVGVLPVTPPHGSVTPRRFKRAADGTDLWTVGGALCARTVNVEGETSYTQLPIHKIIRRSRADGTFRWYAEYALPSGLIHRERLDQTVADLAARFNRPEHLQPLPKGSPQYDVVYRRRPDAESLHDTLDSLFHKGRMIAYSRGTQDLAMFSFVLAQNSISRWVHRLRNKARPLTF